MKHAALLLLVAVLCSSCSGARLTANATGITVQTGDWDGLLLDKTTNADKTGRTILDTRRGNSLGVNDGTVREWAIARIKAGETIDQVAKALGIDPKLLREWIQ